MSDGPFTSPLPKPCWNPVLERAANESFTIEQIRESVLTAIAAECRELPRSFQEHLRTMLEDEGQSSFLRPGESGEIDALHEAAEGDALAYLIVRWIEDALQAGRERRDAILDALIEALRQGWGDRARMMEEHAQRDIPDHAIAQQVRERLREAAPSLEALQKIAKAILKIDGETVPRSAPKHTGIEQGPLLKREGDDEP
jgi:hypothetical protein